MKSKSIENNSILYRIKQKKILRTKTPKQALRFKLFNNTIIAIVLAMINMTL